MILEDNFKIFARILSVQPVDLEAFRRLKVEITLSTRIGEKLKLVRDGAVLSLINRLLSIGSLLFSAASLTPMLLK